MKSARIRGQGACVNAIVAGRELRAAQGEIARPAGLGGRLRAGFLAQGEFALCVSIPLPRDVERPAG